MIRRSCVYDLHVMRAHYEIAEVAALARAIMSHDAAIFGNYRADAMAETLRAVRSPWL